ncbi:MAG: UrcA family protein [Pseudomonadota bacterium]
MKFSIVCVCASMALAAPALASGSEEVTVEMFYADADLATSEGAKAVYESLEDQAEAACQVRTTLGKRIDSDCVAELLTGAIDQIESPILTAVHEGTQMPYRVASK